VVSRSQEGCFQDRFVAHHLQKLREFHAGSMP
jgi:hypothetical protein